MEIYTALKLLYQQIKDLCKRIEIDTSKTMIHTSPGRSTQTIFMNPFLYLMERFSGLW